jgi:uncharacterized protein (TIGR03437 family)
MRLLMTYRRKIPATLLLLAALLLGGLYLYRASTCCKPMPDAAQNQQRIREQFGKLPMHFEANRGQAESEAAFLTRAGGYQMSLASETPLLTLRKGRAQLRLQPAGRTHPSRPVAESPLPGRSNYFIGNDPSQWRTDVPTYSKIRYPEVYPGIDLVYYGNGCGLEYDFIVAPGHSHELISLEIEGAQSLQIAQEGHLALRLNGEAIEMRKPVAYQPIGDEKRHVDAAYRLAPGNRVEFQLGAYDANLPLVIDPIIEYSTFFGGSGADAGYGITLDAQNNIYVTGQTSSANFPLKNAYDSALEGANDAFVLKLNAQGNAIVFSTYIGGRNSGDRGWAVAVDRAGNIYFTGETNSLNFPTVNAVVPGFRGNVDGFVAKLNIEGNVLLYSTYLGGGFADVPYAIALDRFDNVYVTGRTESANFPLKSPMQDKIRGQRDAFITKLGADGELLYSTYLGGEPATTGGRDEEVGYGIAIDAMQNIYVIGYTTSPTFPTQHPIQPLFGGVEDVFISKINAAGTGLVYSTYLGGSRADVGRGIAVDAMGYAYITGYTLSLDFPVLEALQPEYRSSSDGFVAKINPAGTGLIYSTYLGGAGEENTGLVTDLTPACAITVDLLGNAYVTGKTASMNFPVARAIRPALSGDDDAYVAKIDPAGSELIYSTYLGSTFTGANGLEERGLGITVTRLGTVYVTGQILRNDFPTTQPLQAAYGGGLSDAFITRIGASDLAGVSALSAASFVGGSFAPESIVAVFGSNLASATEVAKATPLPTSLLGTTVKITDKQGVERLAPLFFVSPDQINFEIPAGISPGKARITVTNSQNTMPGTTVLIDRIAPGLFSANASGQGLAAAVAVRVKADGTQSFEPVVAPDNLGQLFAVPIDLGPESDRVFLILFGTGWRNNTQLTNASVRLGGVATTVTFAGAQGGFVGQDQINLEIPRSLAGRGLVPITVIVDGWIANSVNVSIR